MEPEALGSQPKVHGCGEGDGRKEGLGASVTARGDTPPVFLSSEHELDPVRLAVAALVVFDELVASLPTGDTGRHLFVDKGFAQPIRRISPVPQEPVRGRKTAQQSPRPRIIADLTGRHEEPDLPPTRIGDGMQLGVHAAIFPPPLGIMLRKTLPGSGSDVHAALFAPGLEAVRCALR